VYGATDTGFIKEEVKSTEDVVDSCVATPTVPPSLNNTLVVSIESMVGT
jgi:hypothetical protein